MQSSIHTKLILAFLITVLLPLIGTGLYGNWTTSCTLQTQALDNAQADLSRRALQIEGDLRNVRENILFLSQLASLQTLINADVPAPETRATVEADFAVHDKPSMGLDTGGVSDAGIITFSASYQDWAAAEVLFISGTDPFETKTVVFTSWIMGGPKLIMALPRRTAGVAYAEKNGGLFLQVIPGTDTLLHLAISRIILENG